MKTKHDNYLGSHAMWNATSCTFSLPRNSPNFDKPRLVILCSDHHCQLKYFPVNQRNIQYVRYWSSSEYCTAGDIIRWLQSTMSLHVFRAEEKQSVNN